MRTKRQNLLTSLATQLTLGRVLHYTDRLFGQDRNITVGPYRAAVADPERAYALFIDNDPHFHRLAESAASAFVDVTGERAARSVWSRFVLNAGDAGPKIEAKPAAPAQQPCSHLAFELQRPERMTSRNRLRVDAIETGIPRCMLKKPDHWPQSASAINWLASGGSPFVFGHCFGSNSASCPLKREQAELKSEGL